MKVRSRFWSGRANFEELRELDQSYDYDEEGMGEAGVGTVFPGKINRLAEKGEDGWRRSRRWFCCPLHFIWDSYHSINYLRIKSDGLSGSVLGPSPDSWWSVWLGKRVNYPILGEICRLTNYRFLRKFSKSEATLNEPNPNINSTPKMNWT